MKRSVVSIATLLSLLAIASLAQATMPMMYTPPQSLDLEIKLKSKPDSNPYAVLTATMKSLIGNDLPPLIVPPSELDFLLFFEPLLKRFAGTALLPQALAVYTPRNCVA